LFPLRELEDALSYQNFIKTDDESQKFLKEVMEF
jgi:hypothetical protein